MAHSIKVETMLNAPVQEVWSDLAEVGSHVEWMADAERIEFVGDQRSGVGTKIEVLTRVGPISLSDVMEFTAWEPPHRMAIRHEGIVTGEGEFLLAAEGDSTRFTWQETLDFPLRLGGALGERIGGPILKAVWRRNLERLAARFE